MELGVGSRVSPSKEPAKKYLEFFLKQTVSSSASFWYNCGLFKQKTQILQQINVKNVPPVSGVVIQTHDLLIMSILL